MGRFGRHKWWMLTALLTIPIVALAEGVPNVFSPNTAISSSQVNANFKNLADRVTALETAIQSTTTATVVMDGVAGPLGTTGKTATFTTAGGPIVVITSGSAWSKTAATIDIAVQLDGTVIGHLTGYTNESSSHKTLPTKALSLPAPAAGSHTIGILQGNTATIADANDYFSVTVIELGH